MMQSKHPSRARAVRLCQVVASQHSVEPLLTTEQIAFRLRKSPKTIRNWLRLQVDSPEAFKDGNEWYVYQSELLRWEQGLD